MASQDVCAWSEVEDGGKLAVTAGGVSLLVLRSGAEVFVIQNRCPHLGLPLASGTSDGRTITCKFHGARFDAATGQREKKAWLFGSWIGGDCVKTYPAKVEGGRVIAEV